MNHLAAADGIGNRHDDDLAQDGTCLVSLVEQADQMMLHQHRRNLVGMKRCLEIGLGPRTGFAITVHDEMARSAEAGKAEIDAVDGFHGWKSAKMMPYQPTCSRLACPLDCRA